MGERGRKRRRGVVLAAVVLVLSIAVPGLAGTAGASAVRAPGGEVQARSTTHNVLVAKRRKVKRRKRMSAAKKKALLVSYIKAHPGVVAKHAQTPGVTLKMKLALKRRAALARAKKAKKKKHKKPGAHPKAGAKPAAHKKKKKKKSAAGFSLHHMALVLAVLGMGALAMFLIGSSVRNGPRSRAKARARKRAQPLPTR